MRQSRFGKIELGKDVRVESALQLAGCDSFEIFLRVLFGGIIDQDFQMPKLATNLADDPPAGSFLSDISLHRQAAPPLGFDHALGLGGVLFFVQISNGDVGALLGKKNRHGPADATVAAGDQARLASQLAAAAIIGQDHTGPGPHGAFPARLPFLVLGWPDALLGWRHRTARERSSPARHGRGAR
jgi:hypothetical protein